MLCDSGRRRAQGVLSANAGACPVCGKNGDSKPSIVTTARGLTCSECGRPQPAPPPAMGDFQTAGHLPFDDLDDLVDGLDRRMQQRG